MAAGPRPLVARPLRAVVFDLDGTLIQSLENHWKSYTEVFRTHLKGLREPTLLQVCLLEGQRAAEVIEQLAREQGTALTPARAKELAEEKQRLFRHHGHPPPYPGAHEVLAALRERGLKVGLATGTARENAKHMLGGHIAGFDAVVAGEDTVRSKPDPEPYLKAFAALGVAPEEAAVVENAPLGVESGRRSGARVVAVTHTLPAERLRADVVVADLRAVERVLVEWSK